METTRYENIDFMLHSVGNKMSSERDIATNGPMSMHPIPYPDMNHMAMNGMGIGKPSYESSWTSSPPRPQSPTQSQTSFDTLSQNNFCSVKGFICYFFQEFKLLKFVYE
uniref:CSON010934 protein n=1 Tax=Culicoides sonorensis TaxID=179676 RepID=A0A336MZX3_CULSO